MGIKYQIRKLLWKVGYDIWRFTPQTHPVAMLQHLINFSGVDTVLDVGANSGQFACYLRNYIGYKNRIVSFEPLSSAYSLLKAKADKDPFWEAFNFALGDIEEQSEINIAGNSYSSSLLDMLPSHLMSAPESVYSGKEKIEIKRLDSIIDNVCTKASQIYLKIDTQGFESKVLSGAENSLGRINLVQMEMSLEPLYAGELLFHELHSLMASKNYKLVAIFPGFSDKKSGQLLQVDGVFHRTGKF